MGDLANALRENLKASARGERKIAKINGIVADKIMAFIDRVNG
jgi:hypothetical protein